MTLSAPTIRYNRTGSYNSSVSRVIYSSPKSRTVHYMSSTERTKGLDIPTHRALNFGDPFGIHSLSDQARINMITLLRIGFQEGISPKIAEQLEEGEGIFIDFIKNTSYFAFELHNNGEIIFVKKMGRENSQVTEIETADLNQDLFN